MAQIIVYSTPSCHYCKKVKEYLAAKNIAYEEYDVAALHDKRKEMVEKSGQLGVPVLDFNGEIIVGFDEDRLDQLTQ